MDNPPLNPHLGSERVVPVCQPTRIPSGEMEMLPSQPIILWEQVGTSWAPQEGRAAWVLPALRKPGPGEATHTEGAPKGQYSLLGTIFRASNSLALLLKLLWVWAQLSNAVATHFHLPKVPLPSLLILPNAWICLPLY